MHWIGLYISVGCDPRLIKDLRIYVYIYSCSKRIKIPAVIYRINIAYAEYTFEFDAYSIHPLMLKCSLFTNAKTVAKQQDSTPSLNIAETLKLNE